MNHSQARKSRSTIARQELHIYATQRANPRKGAGSASVDIHAWLLTLALAFLLRDDPYGPLPLQVSSSATPQELSVAGQLSRHVGLDPASTSVSLDSVPGMDPG